MLTLLRARAQAKEGVKNAASSIVRPFFGQRL